METANAMLLDLNESLSMLDKAVQDLENRSGFVLRPSFPDAPVPGGTTGQAAPPEAPVINMLRGALVQSRRIRNHIEDIGMRLAV
jgi:hypothetical protein